jgi:hypothetical protein
MDVQELHQRAKSASDSVYKLADFAKATEHLFSNCPDEAALERYRATWFELEIVNAAALAEWEADGRPQDWSAEWQQTFRDEAVTVINQMVKVAEEMWAT